MAFKVNSNTFKAKTNTFKVTRYSVKMTTYTFKVKTYPFKVMISDMAKVVSQRITNELTRLYAAVNEVANRAVVTSDDIQYFINCLEHLVL